MRAVHPHAAGHGAGVSRAARRPLGPCSGAQSLADPLPAPRRSFERLLFSIEQAWWHYEVCRAARRLPPPPGRLCRCRLSCAAADDACPPAPT